VLKFRDAERLSRGGDLLCLEPLLIGEARDLAQRRLHIRKRVQHRASVGGDKLLLLAFRQIVLALEQSAVKDRLQKIGADAPGEGRIGEERADGRALEASGPGQADLWEEC